MPRERALRQTARIRRFAKGGIPIAVAKYP